MTDNEDHFYRDITPFYHLIYPDWSASIKRQASMLDSIIRNNWGNEISEVLDVACGIGTQCLGLAQLGYKLTASDLSSHEVERAQREANERGLSISYSVADMRAAFVQQARPFDLVIACDNAIPHLLTDDDILQTFHQLYACTRTGGGCLITMRDYSAENRDNDVKLYGSREENGVEYLIFQKWKWRGNHYDLAMYFLEDDGIAECKTHVMRTQYYAIGINRILELMTEAGFKCVERLDNLFFQPVIVGTR